MGLKHRDGGLGEVTTIAGDNGARTRGVRGFVSNGVLVSLKPSSSRAR